MKHILIILTLLLSCGSYRGCSHPFEDVHTSHIEDRIYKPNNCHSDEFHASTLIGVWQFSYNASVGSYELKEVEFFSDGLCDIVVEDMGIPNRHTMTFKYFLNNCFLNFDTGSIYEERTTFSYKIKYFLYPTLTMEDSFGTYELKKVS